MANHHQALHAYQFHHLGMLHLIIVMFLTICRQITATQSADQNIVIPPLNTATTVTESASASKYVIFLSWNSNSGCFVLNKAHVPYNSPTRNSTQHVIRVVLVECVPNGYPGLGWPAFVESRVNAPYTYQRVSVMVVELVPHITC